MARYWQYDDPPSLVTVCDRRQAEQLAAFDHHQVVVKDCWGILITYHWLPVEDAPEPLIATVFFNPAPNHTTSEGQIRMMIRKHPVAPPDVQAVIDQLTFRPPAS
jgi:hypothetical protein